MTAEMDDDPCFDPSSSALCRRSVGQQQQQQQHLAGTEAVGLFVCPYVPCALERRPRVSLFLSVGNCSFTCTVLDRARCVAACLYGGAGASPSF